MGFVSHKAALEWGLFITLMVISLIKESIWMALGSGFIVAMFVARRIGSDLPIVLRRLNDRILQVKIGQTRGVNIFIDKIVYVEMLFPDKVSIQLVDGTKYTGKILDGAETEHIVNELY